MDDDVPLTDIERPLKRTHFTQNLDMFYLREAFINP